LRRDLALLPFRTPKTAEARRRNAEIAMSGLGEFTRFGGSNFLHEIRSN
jgi:hypothetical protein